MRLSELIAAVGDENVVVQSLNECVLGCTVRKAGGYEVRFATDQMSPVDLITRGAKVGVVVWFDRKAVDAALAASKAP